MDNNVLVQKFNPATGNLEWELQRENYDYVQEIARSGKQNNFKIHPCCFCSYKSSIKLHTFIIL